MRLRTLEETVRDGGKRRRTKESEKGRPVRGWRRTEDIGESGRRLDQDRRGRRRTEEDGEGQRSPEKVIRGLRRTEEAEKM